MVILAQKPDIIPIDQALREALRRRPSDRERRQFGECIQQEKGGGPDFPTFDEPVDLAESLFGVGR
ncbi:MAG: hypothetical protein U0974_12885 [Gemmatimonadales bacterium]|nr:hypothetical protein [Gemmatimonadales bacterium]